MKIFRYTLNLLDPLFYSKEGLGGAVTPRYIHATAINLAIAYSLNLEPENQPYIIMVEEICPDTRTLLSPTTFISPQLG